jgi:hypothetical protein
MALRLLFFGDVLTDYHVTSGTTKNTNARSVPDGRDLSFKLSLAATGLAPGSFCSEPHGIASLRQNAWKTAKFSKGMRRDGRSRDAPDYTSHHGSTNASALGNHLR